MASVQTIRIGMFDVPILGATEIQKPVPVVSASMLERLEIEKFIMEMDKRPAGILESMNAQLRAFDLQYAQAYKKHLNDLRAGKLSDKLLEFRERSKKLRRRGFRALDGNETDSIVKSIDVVIKDAQYGEAVEPMKGEKRAYSKKAPKKKQARVIKLNDQQVCDLVRGLAKIQRGKSHTLDVVDGKRQQSLMFNGGRVFARVKHEKGIRAPCDMQTLTTWGNMITDNIFGATVRCGQTPKDGLKRGSSGMIIDKSSLQEACVAPSGRYLIVRGRLDGVLVDARVTLSRDDRHRCEHYSSNAEKFWKSFEAEFIGIRETPADGHSCAQDYTVEDCGKVVAILAQVIAPCWKITCAKCANADVASTSENIVELMKNRGEKAIAALKREANGFGHVIRFLETYVGALDRKNNSLEAAAEIQRAIGDFRTEPFISLVSLNESLQRSDKLRSSDYSKCTQDLLQVVRWVKNRSDSIKRNDLSHFRNKISGKALVNPSLMCDNQLDKNGNFVWGARGYHARRFFNNFFDRVDPTDGYKRHIIRTFPNGQRKLAIGNLIVSTNFSILRQQMVGEPVDKMALTKECVSRREGSFIYSNCCVTDDSGQPLLSEIKMPTKHHLVIGNAGDSKYVDLPSEENGMFIAKEGYCYMNIFLAMLVNVNEADAKDFTKMVRDVLSERLGKWPSLLDVATACYLLTIFHPDTKNAELPRILVDHKSKTMHVIDSYGSINTGYHILKANTVSQLIGFASDNLESDMKYYAVGGTVAPARVTLGKLIKCVYKEKELKEMLEQDPFVAFHALVSPSILIAMHLNPALEKAITFWLNRSEGVGLTLVRLQSLTQRLSRVECIVEQDRIMQMHAQDMLDIIHKCEYASHYKGRAEACLRSLTARLNADEKLMQSGFLLYDKDDLAVIEKNYQNQLEEAYNELSLLERLHCRWRYAKFSSSSTKQVEGGRKFAIKEIGRSCYTRCLDIAKTGIKEVRDASARTTLKVVRGGMRACLRIISSSISYMVPDIIKLVNILMVVQVLTAIVNQLRVYVEDNQRRKREIASFQWEQDFNEIMSTHERMYMRDGKYPTQDECRKEIERVNRRLLPFFDALYYDVCDYQAKTVENQKFEKIIAFIALVMMIFDTQRSDCVYKALTKIRSLTTICGEAVKYQSLDDIDDGAEVKKQTIDFELNSEVAQQSTCGDMTFQDWWDKQLATGRTIPHYRCEGTFVEFTRESCVAVANKIAHGTEKEWIVRGSVGSGKSTGFPKALSMRGRVLILEPTRPLAENVCRQLRGEPFFASPTLRMRGLSSFGSDPITIMTSGYAFAFFANNPLKLKDYDFVQLDECHVVDASCMSFYSLLREYSFGGKIIMTSATPQGRECEFKTQYPVKVHVEDFLSFNSFVGSLGSKSACDVLAHGCNILVYVASYNEVDTLSKLITDKGYKVSKIDGRTMKTGAVAIETTGIEGKPHFLVATNIIENGVTLDVDVVVDFGMKVVADYDVDNRSVFYTKTAVSYGERLQRLGRVGRRKPGFALRIGHTAKGLQDVPISVATQAAFNCFAFGLPVMTSSVSTALMGHCTVRQAQAMNCFELPSVLTACLVGIDGSVHPEIHNLLKPYKLNESEMLLREGAFTFERTSSWMSAKEYNRVGVKNDMADAIKIPFFVRDVPERFYEEVWRIASQLRSSSSRTTMSSISVAKVAYTLKTDVHSIQSTLACVDGLLQEEYVKQAQFQALSTTSMGGNSFSLLSVVNAIKSRYAKDHTGENIRKLTLIREQLQEFHNVCANGITEDIIAAYPKLESVLYQGKDNVAKFAELEGRWNGSLMTKDILIVGSILVGGCWMIYESFTARMNEKVSYQGKNKVRRLKFRDARDKKMGREVYGDDGTIEHYFGSAYTKKGKQKGYTRAMGHKERRFSTFYGFDTDEVSFIRYLDPITGVTVDESPLTDIGLVQQHFEDIRQQLLEDGELEKQAIMHKPGIQGYCVRDGAKTVLKVDLTPHNPLLVQARHGTIAGFPDKEYVLRQTGPAVEVDRSILPKPSDGIVKYEGKTTLMGLRDYNNVSACVCLVENHSDGVETKMHALGFGSYLVLNGHFFRKNNGYMIIKSHHGEFRVKNMKQLKIFGVERKDMALLQLPKDFPPFPRKLRFRAPEKGESIVLVGNNFQDKYISSMVSESCKTFPRDAGGFWKHWISTKEGSCGQPLVSVRDGFIVGIHSLCSEVSEVNYYTSVAEDFESKILAKVDSLEWEKNWFYNPNSVCWGGISIPDNRPDDIFRADKVAETLMCEIVSEQGSIKKRKWMYESLWGNLKAVGDLETNFVTKHVVKGKCPLFELYLELHEDARSYFKPLMGAYGKSALNKEAYVKDIMKYSSVIDVGEVDDEACQDAVMAVIYELCESGFIETKFVTDSDAIFGSLNMKAAVGALYKGKKNEYFEGTTADERDTLLKASCKRLYESKMGIWNGNLKAELRPVEKIKENKTRTFTAAPIETLLGAKVCVDDFNNQFYDHHTTCPWTVGISKFYGGWDKLMRSLPDGWVYCDADGSRFDSSLTPYLLNQVLAIRKTMAEEWDIGQQMIENLYTEIIYTPIATPDGTIVKKFRGNNSGQPSTVVDNTLMVFISVLYSLKKSGMDIEDTWPYIRFFINGDDLIIAVRPDVEAKILDPMSAHFQTLGLNYDFSNRVRAKEDLWFMSHKAILREGKFIPKLEKERIVSILEWTRSKEPAHRLEAICAAMIESWGYDDLVVEIRKFYSWILEQEPYSQLAKEGKAPYISELALRKLYLDVDANPTEFMEYLNVLCEEEVTDDFDVEEIVRYQSSEQTIDAAAKKPPEDKKRKGGEGSGDGSQVVKTPDRDIDSGSSGTFKIARVKSISSNLMLPMFRGKKALNLEHLLTHSPNQIDISNTRASRTQFDNWYEAVRTEYEVSEEEMGVLMNGFMIWCIENGTSPNLNGNWYMMDGDEQLEYPLRPIIENAKPTLRQIMRHFSNVAEAYIEKRNAEKAYMPRYGSQRNLTDMSLARYAFDFYEMTSRTPIRAREAHIQMKAAALKNASTRMFGLDGKVGTATENTERHTAEDVNANTHSLSGARIY